MEGKRRGSNDESSYSKHKIRFTQVSIIKEKHSRYTPPSNQGWEEKEEGCNDESSHSNTKYKRDTSLNHQKKKHSRYTTFTNQGW